MNLEIVREALKFYGNARSWAPFQRASGWGSSSTGPSLAERDAGARARAALAELDDESSAR